MKLQKHILLALAILPAAFGQPQPASFEQPFSSGSPLKQPIPANPLIDPNSGALIAHNIGNASVMYLDAYSGARIFYNSSASDPTYNVTFSNVPAWGPNPFETTVTTTTGTGKCNPLHIPADATRPDSNSDRWVAIVDSTKPGLVCEIWRADKSTGTWTGAFGGVSDINGPGNHSLAGFLTGSGISMMDGIIRASDVRAGVINHALIFPGGCNIKGQHRYPAAGSDGGCTDTGGFVEGMWFQLDPSFDCGTVPAGVPRMICTALQVYGAYDGDNTGGELNSKYLSFTMETDDHADPARVPWQIPGNYARSGGLYDVNGVHGDFFLVPSIPLNRLRVLVPPNQQVVNSRPVITSANSASGTVGEPFSYQITASNSPTSFGASGLPAGLSVNASTGLIGGTPTNLGSTASTISATNAYGTGSTTLTVNATVSGNQPACCELAGATAV